MRTFFAKALGMALLGLAALHGSALAQSTATRYPVVLVHGMGGFDKSFITGDYYYGIVADLRRNGATVLVPEVPAFNSTEVRGEALLSILRRYQAAYGYTKFNLVGHSHGGPTARYVAGVAPGMVASVTSVGGVNKGTAVADANLALGTGMMAGPFAELMAALAGNVSPTDLEASLRSLSTAGMAAFNKRFPAGVPTTACGSGAPVVNGIAYYSVTGSTILTNALDFSDGLILAVSLPLLGTRSDGLVPACSAHLGTVIADNFNWNHYDEVNHVWGLRGVFAQDPVAFYRSQVNRLKNAGL